MFSSFVRPWVLATVLCMGVLPDVGQAQPVWQVRNPVPYGFPPDSLERVFARAEALNPLNSLLIASGSDLVAEQYFRGMRPTQGVNVKSASKSILSALVGVALDEGALDSLDQPIGPFFPDILADDPRKQQITLRNLLTMQAGLESTSFGNYGEWVTSGNWVRDALERPLTDAPGTDMTYSTGTSHLVSVILTKATGVPTRRYAQDKLFDPLGVRIRSWQQDPQGYYFGGNNLALTPTALLRFGQLYLNGGRWNGTQVVPRAWVEASWQTYVQRTYRGFHFGYFWWHEDFGGRHAYFAWGYGGQFVFVVPSIDLVAVATSSLSNRPDGANDHSGRIFRFMNETLIPALDPARRLP
jgi:CubicO group peptidase (beta-lactamase class C family)